MGMGSEETRLNKNNSFSFRQFQQLGANDAPYGFIVAPVDEERKA